MIVYDTPFDPARDITPVDQYGFIDMKTAFDSSIVPSQLPESDSDYNGIDDPSDIVGKPRDIFEAIDSQKAVEFSAAPAPGSSEGESQDE